MSTLTRDFITGALVLLVLFLIALNHYQFKSRERENSLRQRDTQKTIDSLSLELRKSHKLRDSLNSVVINLHHADEALKLKIALKDKEIQNIKGRYDLLNQDSLSVVMDRRAEWRGN